MKDPRAILGVPWDADPRHIKLAYKRLAAKLHPDRNPAPDAADRLKEVIEAFEFLTDPGRQFRSDRSEDRSSSRGSTAATMNTGEFRRQQQFGFAFDRFVQTLHHPSMIPWRPLRIIAAIAAIAIVAYLVVVGVMTGSLVIGSTETFADECFFIALMGLELV